MAARTHRSTLHRAQADSKAESKAAAEKAAEEASGGSDVNLAVGTESKLETEAESAVQRPYIRGQESLHVTREDMVLENE